MPKNPAEATRTPADGVVARLQKVVTTATLVKTLAGLLIGAVGGGLVVYNHFAKAAELKELACQVFDQNQINNEMINTSREIQGALNVLKRNFDSTAGVPLTPQFLAQEIAATVGKIERSLANVEKVRSDAQKRSIMRDGTC